MRKNVFGRQFQRDTNERKALFKSLMSELVLRGRINSTEEKVKAIKGRIEKLVTRTNKDGALNFNFLQEYLNPDAAKMIKAEIAPRFKKRPGGYTRIVKTGRRFADNAKTAFIEWVDYQEIMDKKMAEAKVRKEEAAKTKKSKVKENKKLSASGTKSLQPQKHRGKLKR